jgi:hypothetical protein
MRLDVGIRAVEEPACTLGGRTLSRPDFPVCSPELAERLRLNDVSDLSRCRLLYDSAWNGDWMLWCKTAQVPDRSLNRELGFPLYAMAVEAALQGHGVLIGHAALLEGELGSGRLVEPFAVRAEAPPSLRGDLSREQSCTGVCGTVPDLASRRGSTRGSCSLEGGQSPGHEPRRPKRMAWWLSQEFRMRRDQPRPATPSASRPSVAGPGTDAAPVPTMMLMSVRASCVCPSKAAR